MTCIPNIQTLQKDDDVTSWLRRTARPSGKAGWQGGVAGCGEAGRVGRRAGQGGWSGQVAGRVGGGPGGWRGADLRSKECSGVNIVM